MKQERNNAPESITAKKEKKKAPDILHFKIQEHVNVNVHQALFLQEEQRYHPGTGNGTTEPPSALLSPQHRGKCFVVYRETRDQYLEITNSSRQHKKLSANKIFGRINRLFFALINQI